MLCLTEWALAGGAAPNKLSKLVNILPSKENLHSLMLEKKWTKNNMWHDI